MVGTAVLADIMSLLSAEVLLAGAAAHVPTLDMLAWATGLPQRIPALSSTSIDRSRGNAAHDV